MAFKVSFFDNTEYDYFASDFNNQFKSIVGKSGVSSADDLIVSQTSPASLGVRVGIGNAWIDGFFIQSDTVINLDIPINSSTSVRKHYIVVEIDKQNKTAEIKQVASTTDNQLLLATITMDNTNTAVVQGQILDNRTVATITLDTTVSWDNVQNKPTSYPPLSHEHPYLPTTASCARLSWQDISGLGARIVVDNGGNNAAVSYADRAANADNATKVNNMQVRGGSGLTGASGYITFSW